MHAGETASAASVKEVSHLCSSQTFVCIARTAFHRHDNKDSDDNNACLRISILITLMISLFKALDILHAERIGHGYHVLQDEELYKRVVNEKIHLEVNGKG